MSTPTFFSTVAQPNGAAKFADSAEFDRSVVLRCSSSTFQVGFDSTEAQTGYTVDQDEPLYLVLPAGQELYVYAGSVNVSILVSGSPG